MFDKEDHRNMAGGTALAGVAAAGIFVGVVAFLTWLATTRWGRRLLLAVFGSFALFVGGEYVWYELQPGQDLCKDVTFRKFQSLVGINVREHPRDSHYSMSFEFMSEPRPHVQQVRFLWLHDKAVIRTESYECRVGSFGNANLQPVAKTTKVPVVVPEMHVAPIPAK
ncbi:MAG: hypothetical protein KA271_00925 [Propionivibrio sp.]|nr:hypothetical protein [Propionivibrio sp.]